MITVYGAPPSRALRVERPAYQRAMSKAQTLNV